jgi:hypothetical protein
LLDPALLLSVVPGDPAAAAAAAVEALVKAKRATVISCVVRVAAAMPVGDSSAAWLKAVAI